MTANTSANEPVPDFALRKVVLKELRKHPRPVLNKEGTKAFCLCGWAIPADSPTTMSRARSFSGHQARFIETAVTAWMTEEALREARASGFDVGFSACNAEYGKQRKDPSYPIMRVNPYAT